MKEKELEQWVAPKPAKTQKKSVAAPPSAAPVKKGDPAVKKAPPAVEVREAKPPAGKNKFKRVPEPQGAAVVAPAPTPEAADLQKSEKKKQKQQKQQKQQQLLEEESMKGKDKGEGKDK